MDRIASMIRLLHCLSCGKTIEQSPADLLKHTQTRWPRCCGEVMTLFTQTEKPLTDDTKFS